MTRAALQLLETQIDHARESGNLALQIRLERLGADVMGDEYDFTYPRGHLEFAEMMQTRGGEVIRGLGSWPGTDE